MLRKSMERVYIPGLLPVEVAREGGFTPAHFTVDRHGETALYVERPGPVGRMWVQVFGRDHEIPASAEYLGTTFRGVMPWHLYDVTRAVLQAAGDQAFREEYRQLMGWSPATAEVLWGPTEAESRLPLTGPLVVVEQWSGTPDHPHLVEVEVPADVAEKMAEGRVDGFSIDGKDIEGTNAAE